jgi:hypothetical protein
MPIIFGSARCHCLLELRKNEFLSVTPLSVLLIHNSYRFDVGLQAVTDQFSSQSNSLCFLIRDSAVVMGTGYGLSSL